MLPLTPAPNVDGKSEAAGIKANIFVAEGGNDVAVYVEPIVGAKEAVPTVNHIALINPTGEIKEEAPIVPNKMPDLEPEAGVVSITNSKTHIGAAAVVEKKNAPGPIIEFIGHANAEGPLDNDPKKLAKPHCNAVKAAPNKTLVKAIIDENKFKHLDF